MPRTIKTTVYEIGELSAPAKDNARAWYRQTCFNDDWYHYVFDNFETVCKLLGLTLRTSPLNLIGGGTREQPHIFFRGFSFQSNGACFEGWLSYARGATQSIRAHAPEDTELHRIADTLLAIQRKNFFALEAKIGHNDTYYHEYTMDIDVQRNSATSQPMTEDAKDTVIEALRDLARWLYRRLRDEYEHQTSDPIADEVIADYSWTFTKQGRRFG